MMSPSERMCDQNSTTSLSPSGPLLIAQLVRLSLVKFIVTLLASTGLGEGGIIPFSALYYYITIRFKDLKIYRIHSLSKISLSLSIF